MVLLLNKYCHLYNSFIFKLQEELENVTDVKLYLAESMSTFYGNMQHS